MFSNIPVAAAKLHFVCTLVDVLRHSFLLKRLRFCRISYKLGQTSNTVAAQEVFSRFNSQHIEVFIQISHFHNVLHLPDNAY
jgi:hypothetical protein